LAQINLLAQRPACSARRAQRCPACLLAGEHIRLEVAVNLEDGRKLRSRAYFAKTPRLTGAAAGIRAGLVRHRKPTRRKSRLSFGAVAAPWQIRLFRAEIAETTPPLHANVHGSRGR
jgi:hypothetical protein